MKLGLLTPRYGTEVVGGTEHWLRALVERLASDRGWEVEVFTTCAQSAETWANRYDEGKSAEGLVTVHRFPVATERNSEYLHMLPALRRDPGSFGPDDTARYLELVGPVCPGAVEAAVDSSCDLVAVTPYLYWPTVQAVPRLGRRVIFHGAAHDEPELYLPVMREVFGAVGGLSFNSFAERELVESTFGVVSATSAVVGNAVEEGRGDPVGARVALGLQPDEDFVLCLGRVERSKGSAALAEMWDVYRRRRPGAPRLVMIGPVQDGIEVGAGTVLAGRQPDDVKWGALAGCRFLIAPGGLESFSLVVLEAWLAGACVMVNDRCGPTVEHCVRSGGGISFHDYGELEVGADLLLASPDLRSEMACAGAAYSQAQFGWEPLLDRYERLASDVLDGAVRRP